MSTIPSTGCSGSKQQRIARPRSSDCEKRGSLRRDVESAHSPSGIARSGLSRGPAPRGSLRGARLTRLVTVGLGSRGSLRRAWLVARNAVIWLVAARDGVELDQAGGMDPVAQLGAIRSIAPEVAAPAAGAVGANDLPLAIAAEQRVGL